MSEEVEFDFSSLLKPKEETVTRRQIQEEEPVKAKKTPISKIKPSKTEKKPQIISDLLDPEDIQILTILAKKYQKQGTNVVRHNMRNPFIEDLGRLTYLLQKADSFKLLYQEGLLTKTKYAGQWQIKE